MSMEKLYAMNGAPCACGRTHSFQAQVVVGKGVLSRLPGIVKEFGAVKPFVLSDSNTWKAAAEQVCSLLEESGIQCVSYTFPEGIVEPDEHSVGSAIMHFDSRCDIIIAVGSGVLNDIGKIVSNVSGKPYIIVGTAPSMDGYASATSSMTRGGLKISLNSRSADVILGDTDILKNAPLKLMKAGLGDMIAKYVSICEWRIAHLITGEYYCEDVAELVRIALKRCTDNAAGLLRRDDAAVQAVFEGLVIGGLAMNYAGVSRPASGVEHYISHVLDMRAVEFGTPMDLHGIQCAIGTVIAAKLYEQIKVVTPDRQKALSYAAAFDTDAWNETLRAFLGKGAESMIALEKKERKYDPALHKQRLEVILSNWDEILRIVEEELPDSEEIEKLLEVIEAPGSLSEIGVDGTLLPVIFKATKDIRDKYVLSRLCWDLGILDEIDWDRI